MRYIYIVPLMAAALSGCITSQDEKIAADDRQCLSYGVPKGSPEYIECRARLDQQRSDRQALQGLGRSGGLVGAIERSSNR